MNASCKFLFSIVAALSIAGCMTRSPAPVDERVPVVRGRPVPPPRSSAGAVAPASESAAPTYIVRRGDTLQKIALDNGLDYRELAAWNEVENPNVIRVGQVLRLAAPGDASADGTPPGVTISPLRAPPVVGAVTGEPKPPAPVAIPAAPPARGNSAAYKSEPKAVKLPYSEHALAQLQQSALPPTRAAGTVEPPSSSAPAAPSANAMPPAPTVSPSTTAGVSAKSDGARVPEIDDDDKLGWVWPASGKVVSGFSETTNLKGIDIAGRSGQPVLASAAGKVVYAGTGLRGYGKLIIIKHNKTFLSAYAHNREILVKEGQQVTRGQQIAEMGDSDADQVKLHFEIRRLGKPIDPTRFLPPA